MTVDVRPIIMLCIAGAAMYAAAPDMIFSRRTRFCYGVEVSQLFRPGLRQDLKFIEPTTGKVLCDKYFNRLVKRDELVEHDQVSSCTACLCPVCFNLTQLH